MSTFSGVIVPMVTPFRRDEGQTINYEAGEQLVERIIAGGASGIFTFGSNGEFHVCTPDEKIEFSRLVIERVAGRVPVYVGTGSCSTREAVEMSKRAEDAGASAVSVINPYFMKVSDAEVEGYYAAVAESVKIPVLMYNIPKSTGTNLSPEVVARVAEIDNVKGVKDSSGNMDNLAAYVEAAKGKDVDVLVGSDGKISAAHALGASGAIAGTANLITDVVVPATPRWPRPSRQTSSPSATSCTWARRPRRSSAPWSWPACRWAPPAGPWRRPRPRWTTRSAPCSTTTASRTSSTQKAQGERGRK